MHVESNVPTGQQPKGGSSPLMSLTRVFWALVGPMLLPLALWRIASLGHGWLTRWDMAFFGILVVMIVFRWLELRSGHGVTAYGEPATAAHFRRWLIILVPLALIAWVLANVFGNIVLA
jgi:hypothetical protein